MIPLLYTAILNYTSVLYYHFILEKSLRTAFASFLHG